VRYDFVLMKLPEDVLISVRDVMRAVTDDTEDPYGLLKSRLVSSYAQTKWQLANKLLDVPALGDQRPSVLMDKMDYYLQERSQVFSSKLSTCAGCRSI
jgi:hypothetical protein